MKCADEMTKKQTKTMQFIQCIEQNGGKRNDEAVAGVLVPPFVDAEYPFGLSTPFVCPPPTTLVVDKPSTTETPVIESTTNVSTKPLTESENKNE
ncbi:hypothetical protein DERF_000797 [Dermatophagoides farinae]|uniref:Uncharacterized protein n=1 Tax=Dermatophagoides farinae TaxID=6954 RepID=A0A922LCN1_DERFA|nr:hypothetical protein DERF_000797 [Dermatophagoides farinae]